MTSYFRELDRETLMYEKVSKRITEEVNEKAARKAYNEKVDMVISMLDDLPDNLIAKYTKMSIEEITKIRESNLQNR